MVNQEVLDLLGSEWPSLATEQARLVADYRDWLADENSRQNLTKLITPVEYVDGHVRDVKALLDSGMVDFPAMDLGSGGGVPGLLYALVSPDAWILCDSEGHKADFLSRSVEKFGLINRVSVFSGRAEQFLSSVLPGNAPKSIVVRAVGPVQRIYTWIRPCSTWNNLILLKGPRWDEEWKEFQSGRYKKELSLVKSYKYEVGPEKKQRIIVKLARVPRGTSEKS